MFAFLSQNLNDLLAAADARRQELGLNHVERCAIMSAKSGKCGEDCAYCAQSVFHQTSSPEFPLKSAAEMVAAAQKAYEIGAERFGIVTSGNALTTDEFSRIVRAVSEITGTLPLKVCASLGALHVKQLRQLKAAGLSRYHHNLETAPSYYPTIVSTHTFQERLQTVQNVREAGLELCCAGIFGLGESWQQRLEFAEILDGFAPESLPVNFLVPIAGTRLCGKVPLLGASEALRIIAMLRLSVRRASIRLCAGREHVLQAQQLRAFAGGADSLMIGGYLTVHTHDLQQDFTLIKTVQTRWAGV